MSILSSRLTGEFMKAAAAAARTTRSADIPGPATSFRERFEAARSARIEPRESQQAAGGPDRERDRADAAAANRTREESDAAEPSEDVDEVVEIDAAGDRGAAEERTPEVAAVAIRGPVTPDAAGVLDGGPIFDAAPDRTGEIVPGEDAGQGRAHAAAGSAAGALGPATASEPSVDFGDRRDASVPVDAAVPGGDGSSPDVVATRPVGAEAADAGGATIAATPASGPADAAAANSRDTTAAAKTAADDLAIIDPRPRTDEAITDPRPRTDATITDPRPRAEAATTDPATAGGRVDVREAAPKGERLVEPSAYRAAMADRAAGRDLSPAERQAMALDERIASARAAAAAGRLGMSAVPAGSVPPSSAAASGLRSGGRPAGATTTAMADGVNASAVRPTASTATTANPATANSPSAPAPGVGVDPGVPARTANAGSASGVDAASMPGRPGGGEDAVAQALRGARMLLDRNGGSLTMRLQPGDLGELRVRMEIRGGRVSADFQATSEIARERLEQGLEVLRRGLEERGLQVERLTVRSAETESARPAADSGRGGRDADGPGRGGDGSGSEGRRDDAADGESRGRRDDAPSRRPFADRASSPDALRAFASIFGDRTR